MIFFKLLTLSNQLLTPFGCSKGSRFCHWRMRKLGPIEFRGKVTKECVEMFYKYTHIRSTKTDGTLEKWTEHEIAFKSHI